MKPFRWYEGRQGGYFKMLLATSRRLKFDCYVLRIPDGAEIVPHRDPTSPGYGHHRINVILKRPCIGTGVIEVDGPSRWFGGRIMYMRPDLYTHWMTKVDMMWSRESVYILSIGWLRKERPHNQEQP